MGLVNCQRGYLSGVYILVEQNGKMSWPGPFASRTDGAKNSAQAHALYAYDSDSDTVRFGLRDYAPQLRRFLTADPLYLLQPILCASDPVQCNLFAIGNNDPLSLNDPTGLATEDIWGRCAIDGKYESAYIESGTLRERLESPRSWKLRTNDLPIERTYGPLDVIGLAQLGYTATKYLTMGAYHLTHRLVMHHQLQKAIVDNIVGQQFRVHSYDGVKAAGAYLRELGMPRNDRIDILRAFHAGTIKFEKAGANEFAMRFSNSKNRSAGQWFFPTFTPLTNRSGLALPPNFNSMKHIQSFQIKPGTPMIKGIVAPQLQYGSNYIGGAEQIYVYKPWLTQSLK